MSRDFTLQLKLIGLPVLGSGVVVVVVVTGSLTGQQIPGNTWLFD
jgi:multisubunit Na+/H+ antiporter MnhC subunit